MTFEINSEYEKETIAVLESIEKLRTAAHQAGFEKGYNQVSCGCVGCRYCDVEEWEMPCKECRRAKKDYWRRDG